MQDKKMLSIIIPVYNEEKQIETLVNTLNNILNNTMVDFNYIFVDDGSTDDTWNKLKKLSNTNNISAIKLSRNFGKENAICAGLDIVAADACIIMDCDLQHPPQLIPNMISYWLEENYEIIEAIKESRGNEPLFKKLGSSLFYSLLKKTSGFDLKNASDFKLLDKKVIKAWQSMKENNTFFRAMTAWLGFNRKTISFNVPDRKQGTSKWSGVKLTKLALNAIASFSSIPLQLVTILGTIFMLLALVLGIQTLVHKLSGNAESGFTTVIILQLIIGSVVMLSLGIIGTYISKIYDEVKGRPRYVSTDYINNDLKKDSNASK